MRRAFLVSAITMLAVLQAAAPQATGPDPLRVRQSLDAGWRFHRGDVVAGERPSLDDRSWRTLDVPHDWSIEDVPLGADAPPVLALVPGPWRFKAGDDPSWKDPALADDGWRAVSLPERWDAHGGEATAKSFGWYRRRFDVPATARNRDVLIALGRINDADEAFVNGVKVGGRGHMPPEWYDPFWTARWQEDRYYLVKASLLRGDGRDVIAVRVMAGPGAPGVYQASPAALASGPFSAALSGGGAGTGHTVGGTAWYRRALVAPERWRGRRVVLEFEGVYRDAEVFVNGASLATRPYGYSTFFVDATPQLRYGNAANVIAVKVVNDGANSRWYSGSGIDRHVWLHVTAPVHVTPWGVFVSTPEIAADHATARVETTVVNEGTAAANASVQVVLTSPAGDEVATAASDALPIAPGGRATAVLALTVKAPQLWSLDAPQRYTAHVRVSTGGADVDAVAVPFGIRSIEIDAAHGFRLNGTALKLRGACVHHDNGPLGAAAIDRAEERKIELLKANGYNAVRTSHAPPAPAFLDAADRLGLLVLDESFDMWRRSKLPDDYARDFDSWWERDVEAMVLRDRNHPSVVLWSIGNEIPERGEPAGHEYARRLAGFVRALDPTRGVTAALNDIQPRPWTDADGTFAALDVAGYNYLPQRYGPDHARVPSRVIVATESFPPRAFEAWTAVESHDHVIGDFVWTGLDYLGESGIGHTWQEGTRSAFLEPYPWHVSNCGDIDICGWKRPPSYYRDVLWKRGAAVTLMVHRPLPGPREVSLWGWPDVVPSWSWPGHEGEFFTVDVYSAAARVDLFAGETKVGSQPTSRDSQYRARFTVPYAPGVLRAIGYDAAGGEVGRSELRTTGAPASLRLTADRTTIHPSRNDLAYVTIEVVDARGDRIVEATPQLQFALTGPAELAAVANADPTDVASYRGSTRKAWEGRALVIVRPTGAPGTARLEVRADGLPPATLDVGIE